MDNAIKGACSSVCGASGHWCIYDAALDVGWYSSIHIAGRAPSAAADSQMLLNTVTCHSGNLVNTFTPRRMPGHIDKKMMMMMMEMEINTTEKVYLSVDSIPQNLGSTEHLHHQVRMDLASPSAGAKAIPHVKHSRFHRKMTLSPLRRFQCRARAQHLSDNGVKAALGLIKPRNCRRIVALGAPRVGKTNILQRFLGEEFREHYEATTEDFHTKLYHIRGQDYQIDILDAAGERDFPAKRRLSILTGKNGQ